MERRWEKQAGLEGPVAFAMGRGVTGLLRLTVLLLPQAHLSLSSPSTSCTHAHHLFIVSINSFKQQKIKGLSFVSH